jgi:hypothetical protein
VSSDALRPLREAIDTTPTDDCAAFARAARNAVARAILAAAMVPDALAGPPEREVRELLGPDVGDALTALYRGGDDWTSRAIDLLAPLNELARAR